MLENICGQTSERFGGHFGSFLVISGGYFLGSDHHFGSISALRPPFSDLIAPFSLPRCGATSKYFSLSVSFSSFHYLLTGARVVLYFWTPIAQKGVQGYIFVNCFFYDF